MTPQQISEKLKAQFSDNILEAKVEGVLEPFVKISASSVMEIATLLRQDAGIAIRLSDVPERHR